MTLHAKDARALVPITALPASRLQPSSIFTTINVSQVVFLSTTLMDPIPARTVWLLVLAAQDLLHVQVVSAEGSSTNQDVLLNALMDISRTLTEFAPNVRPTV